MKVQAQPDFGRMPLYFIANEGQMDDTVSYYVQGKDKTLYFATDGITIVLNGQEERWVVKLDFMGANPDAKPIGMDKTAVVISYFKGNSEDWKTALPTYSKIVYPGLWPGIDLVYSGVANRLKYEFIVHPGADPSQIRLAYRGASGVTVSEDGRLEVMTPWGGFFDDVPLAWQEVGAQKNVVPLAYRIEKKASADESPDSDPYIYGFQVGEYDRSLPLMLDPAILLYCGYIGGSGEDYGRGIAVDGSGNAYITGDTYSVEASFPEAAGPDLTHNGSLDAFVAKVNSTGTALLYCGYIGGSGDDYGRGIAVDGSGNAYITGTTSSGAASFPVAVGPDMTYNGSSDAFIAKVNPSGTALLYCGYIGGSFYDSGNGVAVDGSGNAYLTGITTSTEADFPVTGGPDLTFNGYDDAFVAKVNASGSTLLYCGYIGGAGSEDGRGIAVDGSGNAYVMGHTASTASSFPVVNGPDLTHNGLHDIFVTKVGTAGTTLVYCGYIGGSDQDFGAGIALDGSGNAYVTGYASSTESSFPVLGGPDLTHNGSVDAFVAKVNTAGTALAYCGYIGGAGDDHGYGIAVDLAGNAYVAGDTDSSQNSFPVSAGPDLTINGNTDAYVAKVNAAGNTISYCGYVGGSGIDQAYGIAVDGSGNAYLTGYTGSQEATFPVVQGPDLVYNGGAYDAFVVKVVEIADMYSRHAVGDFDGDGADEAAVDFGTAGIYLYNGGSWTQLSGVNPESLVAGDVDGDSAAELLADMGPIGLWLWNAGAWNQLSGLNVERMAAGDVDADGAEEVVGDFGTVGLWLWNAGTWSQLSGLNADYVECANLDGSGGEEIIGDFGATGLWIWNTGAWTQLSGVDADYIAFGDTNGLAGDELAGDFGSTGLWLWSHTSGWLQLSGVNADYMITGDVDGNGDDELFGDFAATGLWRWDSGAWTQLSGVNADFMIRGDTDGNGDAEVVGDFGAIGLWLLNGSSWTQLSGVNADYMMAGDVDGDSADEVLVDFGSLGLWLWNAGAWSQISATNPD